MQNLSIQEIETAKFFTPSDIAKILKVNRQAVYRWIKSGVLPGFKFGGVYKVTKEDFEKFLKASRFLK